MPRKVTVVPEKKNLEHNLPGWRAMHADTSLSVERLQIQMLRNAPAWRKLQMAGELRETMLLFVRSGLEERYPNASQAQIRRLMADQLLGSELASKVYGPVRLTADDGKTQYDV